MMINKMIVHIHGETLRMTHCYLAFAKKSFISKETDVRSWWGDGWERREADSSLILCLGFLVLF